MTPKIKQPAEQLVYEFDFAARLGAMALTSIVGIAITARGQVAQVTALTVGAQEIAGAAARVRLDGGTDGELYTLSITVADAGGQRHQLDAEFAVIDLAWSVPDVTTPYASVADFVTRFGIEHTVRLTDELGTGRIDRARIAAALADAQAIADGYLAARYVVPVTASSPLLKLSVLDLANLRLHRSEAPAGIKTDGERAIATFKALGEGKMQLPAATVPEPAAASVDPVVFVGGTRQFTDQTLQGW